MSLKRKPVTGMRDILPEEMELREYLINQIKETYRTYGFQSIETPCVEHIENLCSKQGGDNEKLIFKVMKRGEKLRISEANEENDLADSGLRYDLTVPLARYYANHANELPMPFKAMQIGNVWRADRPQKGRFRQFMQCDIDILGEKNILAEIELILATTSLLGTLGFSGYTVCINDRQLLKGIASYSGFQEKDYEDVFIILDKKDKVGLSGVERELVECGFDQKAVTKFIDFFHQMEGERDVLPMLEKQLGEHLDPEAACRLKEIFAGVEAARLSDFTLRLTPSMVRGQSYYTGTLFEVIMDEFGSSVAGGGRYDKMIGLFAGQEIPACGFSIGFERIVMLLLERGFQFPEERFQHAYLLDKNLSSEKIQSVLKKAMIERAQGRKVTIAFLKKNKKFQKEQLMNEGYRNVTEIYENEQDKGR